MSDLAEITFSNRLVPIYKEFNYLEVTRLCLAAFLKFSLSIYAEFSYFARSKVLYSGITRRMDVISSSVY